MSSSVVGSAVGSEAQSMTRTAAPSLFAHTEAGGLRESDIEEDVVERPKRQYCKWLTRLITDMKPETRFIIVATFVSFFVCMTYSLPSAFLFDYFKKKFPESNAITATFVYASFGAVSFISAPFLGLLSGFVGRKVVLLFGLLAVAASTAAFAFVSEIIHFFVCRCFQGFGAAAVLASCNALLADHFSDTLGKSVGMYQMGAGLALVTGTPVGAILYEISHDNFKVPFLVIGGILALSVFVVPFILPDERLGERRPVGIRETAELAVRGRVLFLAVNVIVCMGVLALLSSSLPGHLVAYLKLKEGEGQVFIIAAMFLVVFAGFLVSSFVSGWLHDCLGRTAVGELVLVIAGMGLLSVGLVALGPLPFADGNEFAEGPIRYAEQIGSLLVIGLGVGLAFLPSLPGLVREAKPLGSVAVGVVSGMWTGCYNVAQVGGPLLGEIMVGMSDFPWSMVAYAAVCVLFVVCSFAANTMAKVLTPKEEDSQAYPGLSEHLLTANSEYFSNVVDDDIGDSVSVVRSAAPTRVTTATHATGATQSTRATKKSKR